MYSGRIAETGIVIQAGPDLVIEAAKDPAAEAVPRRDGDRHGTAYHVPLDLAAGSGTGVSAHDRAATIRRAGAVRGGRAARRRGYLRGRGSDGHLLTGSAMERFALAWSLPPISIRELAAHL